jgi:hypothetical protein
MGKVKSGMTFGIRDDQRLRSRAFDPQAEANYACDTAFPADFDPFKPKLFHCIHVSFITAGRGLPLAGEH